MLFSRNFNSKRLVLGQDEQCKQLDNPGLVQRPFFCSALWSLGPFCHSGPGPNYDGSIARILHFFWVNCTEENREAAAHQWSEAETSGKHLFPEWNNYDRETFRIKEGSEWKKFLSWYWRGYYKVLGREIIDYPPCTRSLSYCLIFNPIRHNYYVDFLENDTEVKKVM